MNIISKIEGIGQKRGILLNKIGVFTLEDLRSMDVTQAAKKSGISEKRLFRYKAMAELQQVDNIDHQVAEALVRRGGITSLNDLAQAEIGTLAGAIQQGIDENIISEQYQTLDLSEFHHWGQAAQELTFNEDDLPRKNGLGGLTLVRPNLGRPLLMTPSDLDDFTITIAGGWENLDTRRPPSQQKIDEFLNVLSLCWTQDGEEFSLALRVDHIGDFLIYEQVKPGIRNTCLKPADSMEHQYLAGFRWECDIQVSAAVQDIASQFSRLPVMCDFKFSRGINYHAIHVTAIPVQYTDLKFMHWTDTHVSSRNDVIPDFFLNHVYHEEWERKLFKAKFRNYNDNFRAAIKYANQRAAQGKLDLIILTGDVVDFIYSGYFNFYEPAIPWTDSGKYHYGYGRETPTQPSHAVDNFQVLVNIITGRDGKGERMNVPIFIVPGNHDYLPCEPMLAMDLDLNFPWYYEIGAFLTGKSTQTPYEVDEAIDKGEAYQLTTEECIRFDRWKMGLEYENVELKEPKVDLGKARKFLDMDTQAFSRTYLHRICYDTDFIITIGPHQLVCLNTGWDIGLPSAEKIYDVKAGFAEFTRHEQHAMENRSQNLGVTAEHFRLLSQAQNQAGEYGKILLFHHAPMVHQKQEVKRDYLICRQVKVDPGFSDLVSMLEFSRCDCDSGAGYQMILLPGTQMDQFHASFSGHTHDTAEYRIHAEDMTSEGTDKKPDEKIAYNIYAHRYGREIEETQDRYWLDNHKPLFLLSGNFKARYPQMREVRMDGFGFEKVVMEKKLPRLNQEKTAGPLACLISAASSAFRSLGYKGDKHNYSSPIYRYEDAVDGDPELAFWDFYKHFHEMIWLAGQWIILSDSLIQGTNSRRAEIRKYRIIQICKRLGLSVEENVSIDDLVEYKLAEIGEMIMEQIRNSLDKPNLNMDHVTLFPHHYMALGIKRWLNRLGLNPEDSMDALNSDYLISHYFNTNPYELIGKQVCKLFYFASAHKRHPLMLWYAFESTYLAESGEFELYGNKDWNNPNPSFHMDASCIMGPEEMIAVLREKFHQQALIYYENHGLEKLAEFYGECVSRLNAWSTFSNHTNAKALGNQCITNSWDYEKILKKLFDRINFTADRLYPPLPEPELTFSRDSVDFGQIGVGQQWTDGVTMINNGEVDITIIQVELEGAYRFSIPITTPYTMRPNSEEQLFIDFHPEYARFYQGVLKVHIDDAKSTVKALPLKGWGVEWFHTDIRRMDFGEVPTGRNRMLTVKVENRGPEILHIEPLELHGDCYTCSNTSAFTLPRNQRQKIHIVFSPERSIQYDGSLKVICSNYQDSPEIEVMLTGKGMHWFQVIPDRVDFGTVPKNTTSSPISIHVLNHNLFPITVCGIRVHDDSGGSVFQFLGPLDENMDVPLESGEEKELGVVTAKPTSRINYEGTLIIIYREGDRPSGITQVQIVVTGG